MYFDRVMTWTQPVWASVLLLVLFAHGPTVVDGDWNVTMGFNCE